MFTGIIETLGSIIGVREMDGAKEFSIEAFFTPSLKIGDSIAHNGICLTVTKIEGETYSVVAVPETLNVSNLNTLKKGDHINLERAMPASGRFDGHIVQGHVDETALCTKIANEGDHKILSFCYNEKSENFTVEKGSVTVDGISLTVINPLKNTFSVAIIPHTFENTNLQFIAVNSIVNIEFDILGKYLKNLFLKYQNK